ncbi:hypothetical protein [Aquamicrobium defluvii]|nr:hypothetical protein [Aquamicrobium defluvii]
MIVYVVLPENDNFDLDQRIAAVFPNNSRKIAVGQWLVAADLTAQSVSELIGFDGGRFGRGLVAGIDSYNGWHLKDIWDWIALKRGQ